MPKKRVWNSPEIVGRPIRAGLPASRRSTGSFGEMGIRFGPPARCHSKPVKKAQEAPRTSRLRPQVIFGVVWAFLRLGNARHSDAKLFSLFFELFDFLLAGIAEVNNSLEQPIFFSGSLFRQFFVGGSVRQDTVKIGFLDPEILPRTH